MKISLIAAVDRNNVIGKSISLSLPWRLPADLRNFKEVTMGKTCIVGRKTWESFDSTPLPGRKFIIVTRHPDDLQVKLRRPEQPLDTAVAATSLGAALEMCEEEGLNEVFVIGGAEIYHQCLPMAHTVYLSRLDLVVEGGDVFFPEINRDEFRLDVSLTHLPDGELHTHRWTYQIWNRIEQPSKVTRYPGHIVTNLSLEFR
ncbi:dihydrofolate reductase [Erwinia phage vB_EamM_Asesino]|uniref:dihydrofolate reductase n=1 Tax=Erwinia phage vB_EamM_Asesino TaxID=1883370 RepID=A0A1B2I9Y3_9CAUD|nr:dihydrofolate reductase [Erwinia phage vB_EamM_Asesino]ANZ48088.1 putative dihydrofolate reductase [Erwinia phage vB_EamM_Asesino]